MRAWRILLPLGSSHKLLAGPGLGARAAIFWAPIWGRLKLFNLGPHLWKGYNSGCLWAMRAFPLLRKRLHETAGAQFDSSFQHQVLIRCAYQNLFTAWIHWQTTAAVCPTCFFVFASVRAVMTNTTCFLSKFVMILKYTPFSRTYCIKFILHRRRVFPPDIIILTILQGE